MSQTQTQDFKEWLDSAVDPDLILLCVRSLEGSRAYDYLFYSDKIERLNTGRLAGGTLKSYSFLEDGGWWVSGVDPLNDFQPMLWGAFKSRCPRIDFEKRKPIKYEHPPKTETRVFLLPVPDHLWEKASERYNIPIKDEERQRGFWWWVHYNNVPIVLVEGAKKAGCLLSSGYAAIALPGITGGVRTRDDQGNKVKPYLIPDLQIFATPGRQIYLCFDCDAKRETVLSVSREISKIGEIFSSVGCEVRVITLLGPEKGVDDFVVAQGREAFDALYQSAIDFGYWQARQLYRLTYKPDLRLNQRYLGAVPFPKSGLIAIKSPKGTGKTAALEPLTEDAICSGQPTLAITHRIQLGRTITSRLGLDWITEVQQSETGELLGYGLCIDSLHPNSQARFNFENFRGANILVDEVEQVIWHAQNSSTCREKRVAILQTLEKLTHFVISTGGRVVIQDADLSDVSVDYFKAIAGIPAEPWVVVNDWKPEQGWDVTFYDTKDTSALYREMDRIIATGPIMAVMDSQKVKGKWSTQNVERQLAKRHPNKRILRIDKESVADPSHPAYGCAEKLNDILQQYDIIIASPSIGTGVSINIKDYFKGVFGIFKGAVPTTDVLQALARVRDENVPRFVWTARYGVGKIGNGSSDYYAIAKSQEKVIKTNIHLLRDVDFDIDSAHNPIHLRTWAKIAARINAGMSGYRQAIFDDLKAEGHQVKFCRENELKHQIEKLNEQSQAATNAGKWREADRLDELAAPLEDELVHREAEAKFFSLEAAAVQKENKQAEAEAVCKKDLLAETEYLKLKDKHSKTASERHAIRKYELHQRYGVEVTPELKIRDDDGWHPKIRMHYYLTHNPEFVRQRDRKHLEGHLERGEGKVCQQDLKLVIAPAARLNQLNITQFLDPTKEFRATDLEIEQFAQECHQTRWNIKEFLGITIHPKAKPMEVVQSVLRAKLGLTLKCVRQERTEERDERGRRKRVRVYQFVLPEDGRYEIFEAWQQRDLEALEKAATANTLPLANQLAVGDTPPLSDTGSVKYIDLSDPVSSDPVSREEPPLNPQLTKQPAAGVQKTSGVSSHLTGLEGMLVACRKFGRMFKFRLERLVDNATAVISSAMTGEIFTVPVSELAPWEGVA